MCLGRQHDSVKCMMYSWDMTCSREGYVSSWNGVIPTQRAKGTLIFEKVVPLTFPWDVLPCCYFITFDYHPKSRNGHIPFCSNCNTIFTCFEVWTVKFIISLHNILLITEFLLDTTFIRKLNLKILFRFKRSTDASFFIFDVSPSIRKGLTEFKNAFKRLVKTIAKPWKASNCSIKLYNHITFKIRGKRSFPSNVMKNHCLLFSLKISAVFDEINLLSFRSMSLA